MDPLGTNLLINMDPPELILLQNLDSPDKFGPPLELILLRNKNPQNLFHCNIWTNSIWTTPLELILLRDKDLWNLLCLQGYRNHLKHTEWHIQDSYLLHYSSSLISIFSLSLSISILSGIAVILSATAATASFVQLIYVFCSWKIKKVMSFTHAVN